MTMVRLEHRVPAPQRALPVIRQRRVGCHARFTRKASGTRSVPYRHRGQGRRRGARELLVAAAPGDIAAPAPYRGQLAPAVRRPLARPRAVREFSRRPARASSAVHHPALGRCWDHVFQSRRRCRLPAAKVRCLCATLEAHRFWTGVPWALVRQRTRAVFFAVGGSASGATNVGPDARASVG